MLKYYNFIEPCQHCSCRKLCKKLYRLPAFSDIDCSVVSYWQYLLKTRNRPHSCYNQKYALECYAPIKRLLPQSYIIKYDDEFVLIMTKKAEKRFRDEYIRNKGLMLFSWKG